jgi:hypothetical protein
MYNAFLLAPGPSRQLHCPNRAFPSLPRTPRPRSHWRLPINPSPASLIAYLPPFAPPLKCVSSHPHTPQQIQAWRTPTNPIDVHSITRRTSPAADTDLIITIPRPEDAPRIAARLLSTANPFALLLPADLAPRIAAGDQFDGQPDLRAAYQKGGKMMFIDSDFFWFIGNIPSLSIFSKLFSQVLDRA